MEENKYKIKVSGEKLKIKTDETCFTFDLDKFHILKIKRVDNNLILSSEKKGEVFEISTDNTAEAEQLFEKLSKKILRKNKRFRASIFISKIALALALLYLAIKFVEFSLQMEQVKVYEAALQSQRQYLESSNTAAPTVEADLTKAAGNAQSVEDIFYVE